MNKRIGSRILVLAFFLCAAVSKNYAQIDIVKNGKAVSRILVDKTDSVDLKAALLLQDFSRRITDISLDILPIGSARRKGDILIEHSSSPKLGELKEDGFKLTTTDEYISITGGEGNGAVVGVVTLLE
ncbi:MAG: glycoside hydrolase family 20 zincin-like fold domain-containing protein, partial [Prevotella sp.]|nr:glycoside hydrolase family 20 zincin-like fold domain-containing protein [Prevotella sp.]